MNYDLSDNNIATITMDDGKANVVGNQLLDDLNACLDKAESEKPGAVIIRGREGMFSGGFDLREFEKGLAEGKAMALRGFELLVRMYSFPLPLVAACTGHGVAMGVFIIMACDSRIGLRGNYKITLPVTAIGMGLPAVLTELTESRVVKRHMTRAILQSQVYNPDQAVEAGFTDEAVDADSFNARTLEVAEKLAELPQKQYAENKLSIRAKTLDAMKDSIKTLKQKDA